MNHDRKCKMGNSKILEIGNKNRSEEDIDNWKTNTFKTAEHKTEVVIEYKILWPISVYLVF